MYDGAFGMFIALESTRDPMHLEYGEHIMQYRDRVEAGQQLATKLTAYANRPDVLVLGLPRGGVPVAFAVAERLGAALDVFVVRKLGLPGHEELAMGAISTLFCGLFTNRYKCGKVIAHGINTCATPSRGKREPYTYWPSSWPASVTLASIARCKASLSPSTV